MSPLPGRLAPRPVGVRLARHPHRRPSNAPPLHGAGPVHHLYNEDTPHRMTAYTPAVETALIGLCFVCSVGMYGAVLMVGVVLGGTDRPRACLAAPA